MRSFRRMCARCTVGLFSVVAIALGCEQTFEPDDFEPPFTTNSIYDAAMLDHGVAVYIGRGLGGGERATVWVVAPQPNDREPASVTKFFLPEKSFVDSNGDVQPLRPSFRAISPNGKNVLARYWFGHYSHPEHRMEYYVFNIASLADPSSQGQKLRPPDGAFVNLSYKHFINDHRQTVISTSFGYAFYDADGEPTLLRPPEGVEDAEVYEARSLTRDGHVVGSIRHQRDAGTCQSVSWAIWEDPAQPARLLPAPDPSELLSENQTFGCRLLAVSPDGNFAGGSVGVWDPDLRESYRVPAVIGGLRSENPEIRMIKLSGSNIFYGDWVVYFPDSEVVDITNSGLAIGWSSGIGIYRGEYDLVYDWASDTATDEFVATTGGWRQEEIEFDEILSVAEGGGYRVFVSYDIAATKLIEAPE